MTIRRAVKYFVYANLVAWLLTFSFAGLLVWALMDLEACGTGNVENGTGRARHTWSDGYIQRI